MRKASTIIEQLSKRVLCMIKSRMNSGILIEVMKPDVIPKLRNGIRKSTKKANGKFLR